jgi:hypothetical protein
MGKVVKFENGKVLIEFEKTFDPNQDGEPIGAVSVRVWLDLSELPDEALDYWKSKKEK